MNYEDMSDYKINRKVLWLTKGENKITYKDPKSPSGVLCHGMDGVFDPCNNPSDAWNIIVKNNISILKSGNEWMATWSEYGSHMAVNDIYAKDKNPLKAACICFLKMKEAEKCQQ